MPSWGECSSESSGECGAPRMDACRGTCRHKRVSVLGWGPRGVGGAGSWRASWGQYYMCSVHVGCAVQVGAPKVTML